MDPVIDFYTSSISRQLSSRRMLFVQATANFEDLDSALLRSLTQDLEQTTSLPVLSVQIGDGPLPKFVSPIVIILTGLNNIADNRNSPILANIRPALTHTVEQGSLLLIFSEVPRLRLGGHIGSLVSMDCAHYRLEKMDEATLELLMTGLPGEIRKNILLWSQAQPSLLRCLVGIARLEISNRQKRVLSDEALSVRAAACFAQIGPDLATWLESWLFESPSPELPKIDVPDDILQALIAAGLAQVYETENRVELLPGPARDLYARALQDYLSDVVAPPSQWTELASALFTLERMIRKAAKQEFIAQFKDEWKLNLMPEVASKAVARASIQVPAYSSLDALPNPFDWMTLFDLGTLVTNFCQHGTLLAGVNFRVWRLLFDEVEPIRNRYAHMRLMKYGDLDTIRRWIRQLKMRSPAVFGASGL